jgi:hypothetical protein
VNAVPIPFGPASTNPDGVSEIAAVPGEYPGALAVSCTEQRVHRQGCKCRLVAIDGALECSQQLVLGLTVQTLHLHFAQERPAVGPRFAYDASCSINACNAEMSPVAQAFARDRASRMSDFRRSIVSAR